MAVTEERKGMKKKESKEEFLPQKELVRTKKTNTIRSLSKKGERGSGEEKLPQTHTHTHREKVVYRTQKSRREFYHHQHMSDGSGA